MNEDKPGGKQTTLEELIAEMNVLLRGSSEENKKLAASRLNPEHIMAAVIGQRNELSQLNKSLAMANAEAAELLADLEENNRALKDTNRQLARANAHAAELMAEIELRDEKIQKLNHALSQANAYAAELVAKLEISQEELLMAKAKLEEQYAQLQEVEAMRDNLTHMIVHDMRNPLTGISGSIYTLKILLEGQLDETAAEIIDQAIESSSVLLDMINSLLDVSRLEAGKMPLHMQYCDIGDLVEKAVSMLGSLAKSGNIRYVKPLTSSIAYGDSDVIRRVVTNLVANAVHFTPPDGEIQITVETNDDGVKVAVADTGPGIPSEYHEKIFEKFGQVQMRQERKMFSSGLGLTFCKLAVEAHGGRIGLESVVGDGSTFWFLLPARSEPEK
ncbi:MAG: HAMP domain-containing sensor histidine kinase [bacterium]